MPKIFAQDDVDKQGTMQSEPIPSQAVAAGAPRCSMDIENDEKDEEDDEVEEEARSDDM